VEIDISSLRAPEGMAVQVKVRLSGRETSRLFVIGDTLLQLPLEGALPDGAGSPVARTSMFLSELAGRRDGITRAFGDATHAEAFAAAMRAQLETALEAL
jgi:hypothetical protein